MVDFKRSQRVAELLRQELNHILTYALKDPLIGMASISKVTLTNDLGFAKAYVSIIGDDKSIDDTLHGLKRARSFVRAELRNRTDLRTIPEIEFVYDGSAAHAQNIESLLHKIRREDNDESAEEN